MPFSYSAVPGAETFVEPINEKQHHLLPSPALVARHHDTGLRPRCNHALYPEQLHRDPVWPCWCARVVLGYRSRHEPRGRVGSCRGDACEGRNRSALLHRWVCSTLCCPLFALTEAGVRRHLHCCVWVTTAPRQRYRRRLVRSRRRRTNDKRDARAPNVPDAISIPAVQRERPLQRSAYARDHQHRLDFHPHLL